jgi:aspartate racemase
VAEDLIRNFNGLKEAGAEFGAIASNTPHKVFHEVQEGTDLPLVSIVDAAFEEAEELGSKKCLLLGTGFTMRSSFYQERFREGGIEMITPLNADMNWVQDKLFKEVELGIFKDDTRKGFINLIEGAIFVEKVDTVVLGCTELPLIVDREAVDAKVIDSTGSHIEKIVRTIREE